MIVQVAQGPRTLRAAILWYTHGREGEHLERKKQLSAVQGRDDLHGTALPISFAGVLPRNGEVVDLP